MNIKPEILDAIYFHKSVLISGLRSVDIQNSGLISFNEIVLAFVKASIHHELTSQLISDIVLIYNPNKSDKIDYMKLISHFLMDLKKIIDIKNNEINSLTQSQNSFNLVKINSNNAINNLSQSYSNFNNKNLSKTGNGFYSFYPTKNEYPKLFLQNSISMNKSINNFYNTQNPISECNNL